MNSEWEAGWNLPPALFRDDQCKRALSLGTDGGRGPDIHQPTLFFYILPLAGSSQSVDIFQWPNQIALISLFPKAKLAGGVARERGGGVGGGGVGGKRISG